MHRRRTPVFAPPPSSHEWWRRGGIAETCPPAGPSTGSAPEGRLEGLQHLSDLHHIAGEQLGLVKLLVHDQLQMLDLLLNCRKAGPFIWLRGPARGRPFPFGDSVASRFIAVHGPFLLSLHHLNRSIRPRGRRP